jgi:DEAD/DEAH box helicase domain-containing protein
MQVREFIAHLCSLPEYDGQVVHVEEIPARPAEYGQLAAPLLSALRDALHKRGVERFYSHQAEAINAARAGKHVMVATGTASGKTLCYNVPVLQAALEDPLSRALYLFPTKALAQDQLRALRELTSAGLKSVRFATYDGDTAAGSRAHVRKTAAIILSNPDMLNVGILPNHPTWAAFFRHLKYVVLDEAHTYRGVFGSHIACLMRRLRRVCALYGSQPQFILCSATIANPGEHAARLTGHDVVVVDRDGAPMGPRQFVLWNPPYLDEALGVRRSVNSEATRIFAEMVRQGIRNITFARARRIAELILLYAREALRKGSPELLDRVSAYRGGYLAEERREIERRLFSGEFLGVTATNALELGIDVGQLDATVLVGYPGTIASTWQQAGRAGRGKREALSILIGQDNPLDQFFMRHPEELFGRPHEHALIDPGNLYVLKDHLPCAALESPLSADDERLFGEGYIDAIIALEQDNTLGYRDDRWYLLSGDYPAQHVNMRAASDTSYVLMDESKGYRILEEVDAPTAFIRVHPGAIYLHRAESYVITRLDLEARIAYARPIDATYYTQPLEVNDVHIIRSLEHDQVRSTDLYFGRVRVTQQVIGFRRKQQFTEALLSDEPLDLPPYSFETQALWFEISPQIQHEVTRKGLDLEGGLHGVEHACIGILPLFAMCDRNDIGGLSSAAHADTGRAQVFIYDGYPGGVGIARKGYGLIDQLWRQTLEAVRECRCESGCPSCIQSPKCGNNNEPLDKRATVLILERLLGS